VKRRATVRIIVVDEAADPTARQTATRLISPRPHQARQPGVRPRTYASTGTRAAPAATAKRRGRMVCSRGRIQIRSRNPLPAICAVVFSLAMRLVGSENFSSRAMPRSRVTASSRTKSAATGGRGMIPCCARTPNVPTRKILSATVSRSDPSGVEPYRRASIPSQASVKPSTTKTRNAAISQGKPPPRSIPT
jgi:hypothetical protein